jgi:NAD(P)H dehydrogenase (quinone)
MSGRVLLVTGASGNLGREVVERLLARGGDDRLIAGTRDPARLDDLAARGVEVRRLDFDDEAALAAGFAGVDRALLVSTDALDAPGRRAAQHVRAIRAAVASGVDHLVYTSCPNPSLASALLLSHDHATSEAALVDAGVGHTVLRDNPTRSCCCGRSRRPSRPDGSSPPAATAPSGTSPAPTARGSPPPRSPTTSPVGACSTSPARPR